MCGICGISWTDKDLIKLINKFVCNCCFIECNFCQNMLPSCYLSRCFDCRKKSCGIGGCPKFKIDIIITYADSHKELKLWPIKNY